MSEERTYYCIHEPKIIRYTYDGDEGIYRVELCKDCKKLEDAKGQKNLVGVLDLKEKMD